MEDAGKSLRRDEFEKLVTELKNDGEKQSNSEGTLMNCLGDFLEKTHSSMDADKMNCRREFRGLFWELGSTRQSAIGFLQTTSTSERNFLVALSHGDLD